MKTKKINVEVTPLNDRGGELDAQEQATARPTANIEKIAADGGYEVDSWSERYDSSDSLEEYEKLLLLKTDECYRVEHFIQYRTGLWNRIYFISKDEWEQLANNVVDAKEYLFKKRSTWNVDYVNSTLDEDEGGWRDQSYTVINGHFVQLVRAVPTGLVKKENKDVIEWYDDGVKKYSELWHYGRRIIIAHDAHEGIHINGRNCLTVDRLALDTECEPNLLILKTAHDNGAWWYTYRQDGEKDKINTLAYGEYDAGDRRIYVTEDMAAYKDCESRHKMVYIGEDLYISVDEDLGYEFDRCCHNVANVQHNVHNNSVCWYTDCGKLIYGESDGTGYTSSPTLMSRYLLSTKKEDKLWWLIQRGIKAQGTGDYNTANLAFCEISAELLHTASQNLSSQPNGGFFFWECENDSYRAYESYNELAGIYYRGFYLRIPLPGLVAQAAKQIYRWCLENGTTGDDQKGYSPVEQAVESNIDDIQADEQYRWMISTGKGYDGIGT